MWAALLPTQASRGQAALHMCVHVCMLFRSSQEVLISTLKFFNSLKIICDLASKNRHYDIFNPNGVISIVL